MEPSQDPINRVIPELAKKAFSQAYKKALESGDVVCAKDGYLVLMNKDGTYKRLKLLKPSIRVDPNTKYTLK